MQHLPHQRNDQPAFVRPRHIGGPWTFDTTGAIFSPHTDNGVLDPLTTPSLRGAHALAPYGHDGRMLSLRDFVETSSQTEFGGPDPAKRVLDSLVLYIEDIDFLPNRRLTPTAN